MAPGPASSTRRSTTTLRGARAATPSIGSRPCERREAGTVKPERPMRVRAAAMDLRVQLLAEPCLWCWEIVDRRRGDMVRSSWASEWMVYDSKEEALAAGRRRLSELLLRSAEGALPEQGLAGGRRREAMVRLIV